MTPPLPWIVYCRVSTDEQAQSGVSMDAQLAACRAWATAKGLVVGQEIVDPGESGASLKRPGMQQALALVRSGKAAGIIAWRLDRLTRSVRDLLELMDLTKGDNVGLVSVTESLDTTSPMGRFVVHLLGLIAQWERETIAARTSSAMKYLAAQGRYTGGIAPAGTVVTGTGNNRRLVAGPDADVVRQLWPLALSGKSLGDCVEHLRSHGVPGRWSPGGVRGLLLSPRVRGLLVDPEVQDKTRETLAARQTPMRKGSHAMPRPVEASSPLRGLLRCPSCDGSMVQVYAKGNGGKYRYFRCAAKTKRQCTQKDLRCEPIESEVMRAIAALCAPGGGYAEHLRAAWATATQQAEAARIARLTALSEHEQLTARVADLTLGQRIGTPAWVAAMSALNARLEACERTMAELDATLGLAHLGSLNADLALTNVARVTAGLATASLDDQTAAVRALVHQVRITGDSVQFDLYECAPSGSPPEVGGSTKGQNWLPVTHGRRTVRLVIGFAAPTAPTRCR